MGRKGLRIKVGKLKGMSWVKMCAERGMRVRYCLSEIGSCEE